MHITTSYDQAQQDRQDQEHETIYSFVLIAPQLAEDTALYVRTQDHGIESIDIFSAR